MGEYLNGNGSRRTDPIGKDGLKKNRHLGDRQGTGVSPAEGGWDGVLGAGVGTGVGGEMAWGAGGSTQAEARVGAEEGRPVDLCRPGAASQVSGQVLPSRGHP